MAAAEEGAPSHEEISEAFVYQYYHIMVNATDEAYRLYVDGSVITRPGGPHGTMLSFTSLQVPIQLLLLLLISLSPVNSMLVALLNLSDIKCSFLIIMACWFLILNAFKA